MSIRRFLAICSLILVGGILVACGSEDEDPTPTVEPTTSVTVQPTEAVQAPETDESESSPAASPQATAVVASSPQATPEQGLYTGSEADLMQTPQIQPVVPDGVETAEPTQVPLTPIAGTLTLEGRAQQDYSISAEGCVGLGEWRQLAPGTQVIVRDASGTVVDIATLEAGDSDEECSWTFAIEVPGADFFSVSIPMVTEVWFDKDDPAVEAGELDLFVP